MNKLRIFLADDHVIVREGLKSLINAQADMQVVGEADNGSDAWRAAVALKPDVVVMDFSLPELSGAQATERLRKECPEIKVLALTIYEEKGYLHQMMEAGAAGYVLKRAVAEELVKALRTVAAGGSYLDPSLTGKIISSYFNQDSTAEKAAGGHLSKRETEVLRLIAWGYSNKEIGAKLGISVKTVDTYKIRLMEKLELRSRTDIVRYALRQGLLQEG